MLGHYEITMQDPKETAAMLKSEKRKAFEAEMARLRRENEDPADG